MTQISCNFVFKRDWNAHDRVVQDRTGTRQNTASWGLITSSFFQKQNRDFKKARMLLVKILFAEDNISRRNFP